MSWNLLAALFVNSHGRFHGAFALGHCFHSAVQWRGSKVNPTGKVVVVTGCDTGFGRLTAARLHSDGFTVIAACLTPAAVAELTLAFGSKGTLTDNGWRGRGMTAESDRLRKGGKQADIVTLFCDRVRGALVNTACKCRLR